MASRVLRFCHSNTESLPHFFPEAHGQRVLSARRSRNPHASSIRSCTGSSRRERSFRSAFQPSCGRQRNLPRMSEPTHISIWLNWESSGLRCRWISRSPMLILSRPAKVPARNTCTNGGSSRKNSTESQRGFTPIPIRQPETGALVNDFVDGEWRTDPQADGFAITPQGAYRSLITPLHQTC